jgi:hypothetical protein
MKRNCLLNEKIINTLREKAYKFANVQKGKKWQEYD